MLIVSLFSIFGFFNKILYELSVLELSYEPISKLVCCGLWIMMVLVQ